MNRSHLQRASSTTTPPKEKKPQLKRSRSAFEGDEPSNEALREQVDQHSMIVETPMLSLAQASSSQGSASVLDEAMEPPLKRAKTEDEHSLNLNDPDVEQLAKGYEADAEEMELTTNTSQSSVRSGPSFANYPNMLYRPNPGKLGKAADRKKFARQPAGNIRLKSNTPKKRSPKQRQSATSWAESLTAEPSTKGETRQINEKQFSREALGKGWPSTTMKPDHKEAFLKDYFVGLNGTVPDLDQKQSGNVASAEGFHTQGWAIDGADQLQATQTVQPTGRQRKAREMPMALSRQGGRAAQMLSMFSRIASASTLGQGQDPIENQFGYTLDKDDQLKLYASANSAGAATTLGKGLETPRDLILSALTAAQAPTKRKKPAPVKAASSSSGSSEESSSSEETSQAKNVPATLREQTLRAVDRLSRWHGEGGTGRKDKYAAEASNNEADLEDIKLADRLYEAFLAGNVTTVVNEGERHAEQNIAWAMEEDLGNQGADPEETRADIQGTKWRCMGCSSELGVGHHLPSPEADGTGVQSPPKAVTGRLWPSNGHPALTLASVLRSQNKEALTLGSGQTYLPDSSGSESESEPKKPKRLGTTKK